MTPVQGPAEPRSLPEVSVKAIQLVGEAMAHWLPHGGSPKIVSGWTEQEWNVAAWLAYWQSAVPWVLSRAAEDGVDINPEVRSRLEYVNGLMSARTERLLAEAAFGSGAHGRRRPCGAPEGHRHLPAVHRRSVVTWHARRRSAYCILRP